VYEEIHTVGFIKNATIWKNVTLALSREPELRSYTRLLNMGVVYPLVATKAPYPKSFNCCIFMDITVFGHVPCLTCNE